MQLTIENRLQVEEWVVEQCEAGNQNKNNLVGELKSNGVQFKYGWVFSTVDKYIESLYN